MDVVSAVSGYVSKMVSAGDSNLESSSSKMKVLLLDSETVRVFEHARRNSHLLASIRSRLFQPRQPNLLC